MDIIFRSLLVPSKHGIDGFCQLGTARFVDTTGVDPELFQSVFGRLVGNESKLLVASLILASGFHYVSVIYLVGAPCVRQDSVWWDVADEGFAKPKIAIALSLQKPHYCGKAALVWKRLFIVVLRTAWGCQMSGKVKDEACLPKARG